MHKYIYFFKALAKMVAPALWFLILSTIARASKDIKEKIVK